MYKNATLLLKKMQKRCRLFAVIVFFANFEHQI